MNDGLTPFSGAVAGGATVVTGQWAGNDLINHLQRYSMMTPFYPPICQAAAGQVTAPQQLLEEIFGYYGRQTIESYAQALERLTQEKEALEAQVVQYQVENEHRNKYPSTDQRTLRKDEYEKLRRDQRDYASLRSQVQLHNDYEQGAIADDLKAINDMIERLGDSVSDHLVDTYVEEAFNVTATNATVSNAHDIRGLQAWLRQEYQAQMLLLPEQAELLAEGSHLSIDNFLLFFIRARICNILSESIFKPFHPLIESSENLKVTEYYEKVKKQEQQYTAGKWRSITFQTLCGDLNKTMEGHMNKMAEEFESDLQPLAEHLFGLNRISLERCHYKDLHQIIEKSWEWISRVKREVIMLGDFCPMICAPGPFDSAFMVEFEVSSRKPRPKFALCTLGFGLVSQQARGGGLSPNQTVVLETRVLTDSYYPSN